MREIDREIRESVLRRPFVDLWRGHRDMLVAVLQVVSKHRQSKEDVPELAYTISSYQLPQTLS